MAGARVSLFLAAALSPLSSGLKTEIKLHTGVYSGVYSEGSASGKSGSTDSLSPEERVKAHADAYSKDFTVELNMTYAHDTGLLIGAQLNMDTDFQPVSILKIRKNGLLEEWNQDNPDKEVLIGDEIHQVNDILWHHNSRTFAERISAQFKAARQLRPGANKTYTLFIQRPKVDKNVRVALQRTSRHRQMYSRDFAVNFTIDSNSPMLLGMEFNSTVDYIPISITNISSGSIVDEWNANNPEARLLVGDEITQVNDVKWHHNGELFERRIEQQFDKAVNSLQEENVNSASLAFYIQRPRGVNENAFDTKVFKEEFVAEPRWTQGVMSAGFKLESNKNDTAIQKIHANTALSAWNEANPNRTVMVGDYIDEVEADNLDDETAKFNPKKAMELIQVGTSEKHVKLHVRRQAQYGYVRGWLVEMSPKEGDVLGMNLSSAGTHMPVVIGKLDKNGAAASWNDENQEDAIGAGDHIFKANDFLWKNNSEEFMSRLEEQFNIAKKSNTTLKLWVQRPDGLMNQEEQAKPVEATTKEFKLELPMKAGSQPGWKLDGDDEEEPPTVGKIRRDGAVNEWNQKNPDKAIKPGDQLVKVNSVVWHQNTQAFLGRLGKSMRKSSEATGTLSLLVRRLERKEEESAPADGGDAQDNGEDQLGDGGVLGGVS